MSELPNFKEGLIFDIKNGLNADNPIIITADVPYLFKINDVANYNKNYQCWGANLYNNGTGNQLTTNSSKTNQPINSYSDLSFWNKEATYFINIIMWAKGIYVFVNPTLYSGVVSLLNNVEYKIVLDRYSDEGVLLNDTTTFYFKCNFQIPTISYNNNDILFGQNGYEITINNPVTVLDWVYNKNNSVDELKYYQFSLYNSQSKCVVDTGKVYTDITEGNGFVCNSLDDQSTYTLVGYSVTQNGQRLDLPDLTIKTAYTTGRIYANLTIELNKMLAENTIYAEMVNLVGNTTNGDASYIEGEKIDLKSNDNSVVFTDSYNTLKDNFLIRLWINGIVNEEKVTILKLSNPSSFDNIEVYYEDGYFYAIKYSFGLTSRYISNIIDENDVLNGNTYLSILHCNGRIDIYATSYAESEAIAQ